MQRTGLRVFVLLVVSSGAAVFANAVRSKPLAWVLDPKTSQDPRINTDLKREVELSTEAFLEHVRNPGSAFFIDARTAEDYAAGHIAGALNIPAPKKEEHIADVMTLVPRDQLIIIYCEGGNCEASNMVYAFLMGFNMFDKDKVRVFEHGWEFIHKQPDIPINQGPQP